MALGAFLIALPLTALAEPKSSLRVATGPRSDTLTAKVGQPIRLYLDLPNGVGWDKANVGRCVMMTYALQRRIPTTPAPGKDYVECRGTQPGVAMIVTAAGPPEEKGRSDSWQRTTHCSKVYLRIAPDDRDGAATAPTDRGPGETAKVGTKIEIRPLIAPTSLRVGDDLPARMYFNNDSQEGVSAMALRPDGTIERKTTDSVGSATFRITMPGRWIIRYEHNAEGKDHVADVVFEVPAAKDTEGAEG